MLLAQVAHNAIITWDYHVQLHQLNAVVHVSLYFYLKC